MKVTIIDDKLIKLEDFTQEQLDYCTENLMCLSDLETYVYLVREDFNEKDFE